MNRMLISILAASVAAPWAQAEPKFEQTTNCAKATVISGDTCSNAKIRFDLSGCGVAASEKIVDKVKCEGQQITGRTTQDDVRFEASFNKKDDGWGAVEWQAVGEVKTFKKKAPAPVVAKPKPSTPVAVAPAPELAPVMTQAAPTEEPAREPSQAAAPAVKVNAFIDFRRTDVYSHNHNVDTSPVSNERSGFLVEDAALYLSYTNQKLEGMIDIPFSRNGTTDSDSVDLGFAKAKAQLWMRYAITDSLKITLGQFDTFFGFELNDSKDRVFGNGGLMFGMNPVVHSGAYLEYAWNGVVLRAMSANPADRETLGTGDGAHYETGASVGWSNSMARFQLGYLTREMKDLATVPGDSRRNYMNAVAGVTYGPVSVDVEYTTIHNPKKNTLTDSATDEENDGRGVGVYVTYNLNDSWRLAGRYEMLTDDPGSLNYYKATSGAGQVQYKIQDGLAVRAELVSVWTKRNQSTDKYGETRSDIGFLATF